MNSHLLLSSAIVITALSPAASAALGAANCLPEFSNPSAARYLPHTVRTPHYPRYSPVPTYHPYAAQRYAVPAYLPGATGSRPGYPGYYPGYAGIPAAPGLNGFPVATAPWGNLPFRTGAPWAPGGWNMPWDDTSWGAPYPAFPPIMAPLDTANPDEIEVSDDEPDGPPAPVDTDQDGVFNATDLCPSTAPTAEVDGLGCAMDTRIVLEGVKFHTDSDQLTTESIEILDRVANTLSANPDLKVEVAGHTDSDADDAYNQQLSQSRAESVVAYLGGHGVNTANLSAKGYGESQPLVANDSAEHKASNRRVELRRL